MQPDISTLDKLYASGAYLPLGIVVVFLLVSAASRRVVWLQVPNRAHYVSAVIAGLAILVGPATQGTTPNLTMLIAALGAVLALLMPGSPSTAAATPTTLPTATAIKPPSGFARVGVMIAIALVLGAMLFGCTGANRQKDLGVGLSTVITISADVNRQNNKLIEAGITGSAKTVEEGEARLKKYKAARDKVVKDIPIVLDAIAQAMQLDDDPSFTTAKAALAMLLADVAAMKGV